MNVYDGIHWNIYEILPYQRNFNLINSERSIGKTYTTEAYVLDKCIQNSCEFVYIVRTKAKKDKGALEKGFKKVVNEKFSNFEFDYTNEAMFLEDEPKRILGYCIALSEENEVKTQSYPNVKYLIFDEYVIEEKPNVRYYNGWEEPESLLNIYDTIDRREDRVKCFLMGNNIRFHNPYHLHKAFKVPFTEKGKIWISENVLFQNAEASKELKEQKSKSKFTRMIEGTSYGSYANDGVYQNDNYNFIEKLSQNCHYNMTIEYNKKSFGVYSDARIGRVFISDRIDSSCRFSYALTLEDHTENTFLTHSRNCTHLRWLSDNYKKGNVRFVNMTVKAFIEPGIDMIL